MNIAKSLNRITLEEFEEMEKDEHMNYELIDGVPLMSPSQSREHQTIGSKIVRLTGNALEDTQCDVVYEYDIKFENDIFKPDIMIFCSKDVEIPEIIFEILSPSTRQRDLLVKLVKYHEMGIKEYWIVDPKSKTVTVHDFIGSTAETYIAGETIRSKTCVEIIIAVNSIFS